MTTGWTSLTKNQQAYVRKIMNWAHGEGAAVNTSGIAKDLDTWDAAFRAGELPAGTPMVAPDPAALRAERERLSARIAEIDAILATQA